MTNTEALNEISNQNITYANNSDICHSKVGTSRYIFYLKIVVVLTFIFASCYTLYMHSFKKNNAPVNESSLYNPKYK